MSKSVKANIARKMAHGAYIPKCFRDESRHEETIVSKRAAQAGNSCAVNQPLTNSLAGAFAKLGI